MAKYEGFPATFVCGIELRCLRYCGPQASGAVRARRAPAGRGYGYQYPEQPPGIFLPLFDELREAVVTVKPGQVIYVSGSVKRRV